MITFRDRQITITITMIPVKSLKNCLSYLFCRKKSISFLQYIQCKVTHSIITKYENVNLTKINNLKKSLLKNSFFLFCTNNLTFHKQTWMSVLSWKVTTGPLKKMFSLEIHKYLQFKLMDINLTLNSSHSRNTFAPILLSKRNSYEEMSLDAVKSCDEEQL